MILKKSSCLMRKEDLEDLLHYYYTTSYFTSMVAIIRIGIWLIATSILLSCHLRISGCTLMTPKSHGKPGRFLTLGVMNHVLLDPEKLLMEDIMSAVMTVSHVLMVKCLIEQIPVSRCSDPCLPGSWKKARPTINTCCYDCVPCSEGEISNITDSEICHICPMDQWPEMRKTRCVPKVKEFLSYKDPLASFFSITVMIRCGITCCIIRTFISYWDTPLVKANNRTVSFILLVSILLSFFCIFLFLGRPEDITCRMRQMSFGFFFSVAVSSVLAKTTMVCISFKATKPGSSWRKLVEVRVSYYIIVICSSILVLICVIWLSVSPPYVEFDHHTYPGKIIIQCNEGSNIWFYSVLGYLGFLAAVSFVLAFMVRTLPDTFNEAKYITFSMLLFCSVWIAMIPAYLSSKGKNIVAVEIFAILTSSAGILFCIFFPKCYILIIKPERNTKKQLIEK
ncbi:vomeronasal type-2 receptor 26-like [Hyla sarda]|uniref:vomeronasal type-2 receptor 26-like n=1 Tax=Hyla sarda TaxID=327740 RepID=UPI0024C3F6A4|nr:vomeronasal type-2 receptor 26-like [Hyla sarda]